MWSLASAAPRWSAGSKNLSGGGSLALVVSKTPEGGRGSDDGCPDTRAKPMSYWTTPPLALQYAGPGCSQGAFWSAPTKHERLTLQTSQGFNRNWGEFIVVAEPA